MEMLVPMRAPMIVRMQAVGQIRIWIEGGHFDSAGFATANMSSCIIHELTPHEIKISGAQAPHQFIWVIEVQRDGLGAGKIAAQTDQWSELHFTFGGKEIHVSPSTIGDPLINWPPSIE